MMSGSHADASSKVGMSKSHAGKSKKEVRPLSGGISSKQYSK